ncbi:hypothetical protein [Poseidonibacter lekithochrous]|uniref:hypothetical protein n=1 Tax=Poseidonibacter lekithochrous TaxID=1904463 RepID=UPI000D3D5C0E|nr:hypothetical protein [Poseidonibacter lekithochrous]
MSAEKQVVFLENNDNNEIKIECEHCETENEIKLKEKVNCKNCSKPLTGNNVTYKMNKTSAVLGLLGGVVIGSVLEDQEISNSEIISIVATGLGSYVYTFRLKVETEYKIIKTCIDKFGSTKENRDNCFCVVKKMATYLNSVLLKEKGEEWIDEELDKQYAECKKMKDT